MITSLSTNVLWISCHKKKTNYLPEPNSEYSIYVCECIFFMHIIFGVNLVYTKLSVRISSVFYHTFHTYFFYLYICPRNRALWWIMSRSYKSTAWLTWCDVTPGPERSDRYREIRSRPVDQETVKVRQQMFSYVYTMKQCTCLLFFLILFLIRVCTCTNF